MPTHIVTGRANPSNSGTWAAIAAAWSAVSFNGDSGLETVAGHAGPQTFLSIAGGPLDDGFLAPATELVGILTRFDYQVVIPAGNTCLVVNLLGSGFDTVTGNGTGSLESGQQSLAGETWASFLAQALQIYGFQFQSAAGAQAGGDHRIIITNFEFEVEYTQPAPSLDSISPATGSTAGGIRVTLTGNGFTGKTDGDVLFDGLRATVVTVVNDYTLTCNTPAHAAGAVDVVVTGCGTLASGYTYTPANGIESVTPNTGPSTGGVTVTIRGFGFTGKVAADVTFDGVAVTELTVVSDTEMTCVPAPHAAGRVDVAVRE